MSGFEIVAAIIATAASVAGSVYAAHQASQAAEYNAEVAQAQGKAAMDAAAAEAEDQRRRARYILGTQLARTASTGLALEGSPLLVMVDSAAEAELEAQRTLYKGHLAAIGAQSRADLSRMEGRQRATAGYLHAGTTLLTNTSRIRAYEAGRSTGPLG